MTEYPSVAVPVREPAADALIRIAAYVCDRLSALEATTNAYGDALLIAEVRTLWYVVRREMDTAVAPLPRTDA
jgi:hypothetical protein